MRPLLSQLVRDLSAGAEPLKRGRYGVVEVVDEQFHCVRLRPFPKLISWPEVYLGQAWSHRRRPGNRCWLYYNQPRALPNFLALKYVVSSRRSTLATLRKALAVLDWIAELKRTDAIVCDVASLHISDRLMRRWGWQPHTSSRWHRNFIKRFYGQYPETRPAFWLHAS